MHQKLYRSTIFWNSLGKLSQNYSFFHVLDCALYALYAIRIIDASGVYAIAAMFKSFACRHFFLLSQFCAVKCSFHDF